MNLFLTLSFSNVGISLPIGEHSIFGYFVDIQQCEFIPWTELLPNIQTLIQRGKNNFESHFNFSKIQITLYVKMVIFFSPQHL